MLGATIRELRKERQLTQVALAEKAGIGVSTLWKLENNRYNPSLRVLQAIANALDADLAIEIVEDEA